MDLQLQKMAERSLVEGLNKLEAYYTALRRQGEEDNLEGANVIFIPRQAKLRRWWVAGAIKSRNLTVFFRRSGGPDRSSSRLSIWRRYGGWGRRQEVYAGDYRGGLSFQVELRRARVGARQL